MFLAGLAAHEIRENWEAAYEQAERVEDAGHQQRRYIFGCRYLVAGDYRKRSCIYGRFRKPQHEESQYRNFAGSL
jgi:hypothetical protein